MSLASARIKRPCEYLCGYRDTLKRIALLVAYLVGRALSASRNIHRKIKHKKLPPWYDTSRAFGFLSLISLRTRIPSTRSREISACFALISGRPEMRLGEGPSWRRALSCVLNVIIAYNGYHVAAHAMLVQGIAQNTKRGEGSGGEVR
eukprot:1175656-Rhodomonas_salina.1